SLRHQIFPRWIIRCDSRPVGWDREIIKIVPGFRPTFIAAVVDWTELAMMMTIKTAKESGQGGEGDHD
ncbi:MAG: hypothetical protein WBF50_04210, partial [Pseudolabrys sp.]